MKTSHFVALFGILVTSGAVAALPLERRTVPASSGEKTHSLFMGVDISVERDKGYHRVRDVSNSSWVITVNGRPEFIPTERKSLNLKVESSLKLTDASATLANLKSARAYTPGNDPQRRALITQVQMSAFATEGGMAAERELSQAQTDTAFREAAIANGVEPIGPPPDIEGITNKMMKMQEMASGELTGRQFHQGIAEEQLKAENYDAIAIDFEVASEKPLPNPYLIVVAQFHEKQAAPGTARNWIYAQSLDPIDATSRKVSLLRGGFPLGYELEKVDLHLYDRGREVATNLSPKRVALTRDEAFEYLVIEHISAHKGETLPALPAMARLPADLASRLAGGAGQPIYYVAVSKEGRVTEVYDDADYSHRVEDPYFANMVKDIWFKPALEQGRPVETRTKVNVSQLRL